MKSVLEKEEADRIAVVYTPRKFPQVITPTAREFVTLREGQKEGAFRIDRIVAQQTGIADLERASIEKQVDKMAVEKIKEMQEQAYQEAYQLGLDEGRERAFSEHKSELEAKLAHLDELLTSISRLKTDMVQFNEAHLMKLLLHMAARLAMEEIRTHPETILSVLRMAAEGTQLDEQITARVSKSDYEFIEGIRETLGKEWDFIKKITFEESDSVASGGCLLETNFGTVDASIEKRIEKLWEAVGPKIPKVEDTVRE